MKVHLDTEWKYRKEGGPHLGPIPPAPEPTTDYVHPLVDIVNEASRTKMAILAEKPLQPLSHGTVLLVGIKASNLDESLRTHPRVILWDGQNEHWTNKDIPDNVRAVFFTRFIGHGVFAKIVTEAKKRHITIFNPQGTGLISRKVRELLDFPKFQRTEVVETSPEETPTIQQEEPTVTPTTKKWGKLHTLIPFIDLNKSTSENAEALLVKAKELGISTTPSSLQVYVNRHRRAQQGLTPRDYKTRTPKPVVAKPTPEVKPKDVSIEMLENVIKDLQDLRDYLVSTIQENEALRQRIERFKKALSND